MKPPRLVAGLMSGTSLDGVDAVLIEVRGTGISTRWRQRAFLHTPYPRGLRSLVLRNSDPATSRVDDIARLNVLLAEFSADAVRRVVRKAGRKLSELSLIGSHGQTIQHLPAPVKLWGKSVRATLQIGDPSVLATLTGVTTVGDFRLADMAVGGEGAPLVPYFDWLTFRSKTQSRILLNLGGIANITVLQKGCRKEDVMAFDTGPGNMVIDALMQEFFGRRFDKGGRTASKGFIIRSLFSSLCRHPYLSARPPKSTGREMLGKRFADRIISLSRGYDREDVLATLSQFTAYAVYAAYSRFVQHRIQVDEIIVSGGGARNMFIMRALGEYFGNHRVRSVDDLHIHAEAKEAICFAILANETLAGIPSNIPRVTGARKSVVLGKVCRP